MSNVKTILLLLLVVTIWGLISWRFYVSLYPQGDNSSIFESKKQRSDDSVRIRASSKLSLNYTDPFLREGNFVSTTMKMDHGSSKKKFRPPAQTEPFDLAKFIFKGSTFNKKLKVSVAILNVEGEEIIANDGDLVKGFAIVRITEDSINLKSGNKSVWLKKEIID